MRTLLMLLMSAGLLLAQDLAGSWGFHMDSPNGEVQAEMTLHVDGGKVTGMMVFPGDRKFNVENGRWDGKELKFTVRRDRPQGGTMVYELKATLDGGKLKGTSETTMDGQSASQQWWAQRK